MTPFSIPSPSQGVWHLGPLPLRAYALCIIAGIVRGRLARASGAGWPAAAAPATSPRSPPGWCRSASSAAGSTTSSPRRRPTSATAAPGPRPLHLAGRPRHLGRDRARRGRRLDRLPAPRHPAAGLRRRAGAGHRARPGHRPARQLLQPGALRQGRPTCRGRWRSTRRTARRASPAQRPTTRPSSTSCSGTSASPALVIWADRRFRLGHGRAFALYVAAYTVGRGWIEALRVDPAHDFLGLRLNDWTSLLVFLGAVVYFVVSARLRPGPRDAGGARGAPARPSPASRRGRQRPTTAPDGPTDRRRAPTSSETTAASSRRRSGPSARRCASSTSTPTSPAAGCARRSSAPPTAWCPTSR